VVPGEYRFERTIADRVPDCFVVGGGVNRWIEFVAGSDQPYREKTREALRLGFVVHWVSTPIIKTRCVTPESNSNRN